MSRTTTRYGRRMLASTALLGLVLTACGAEAGSVTESDVEEAAATATETDAATDSEAAAASDADTTVTADDGDRLQVVATTSILGDIVAALVGDDADVEVLMAPGVDPHAYQASAAEAATLRQSDLVVANGLMLEESLVDALAAAAEEGVSVIELADQLDPIEFAFDGPDAHDHGDEDHGDEDHGDDDHSDHVDDDHGDDDHADDDHGDHDDGDDAHDHGPEDPHVWFDPVRMADGVMILAAELAAVDGASDADEWMARGEAYAAELLEVHDEMEAMFATIPDENRTLVTNHEALGYLAARYDFEVLGAVVPGSSTQAEADPRSFAELIEAVEEAGVAVVFAENTDSTALAEQLASEVVGRTDVQIEVVRLYTDALGEEGSGAETYPGLLRTTSQLIVDALS